MSETHPLLKVFMEHGETNVENAKFPITFVEKMLDTNTRMALEKGHRDEREELVCRLLANGMNVDDLSLILKIRDDEIFRIESENCIKIVGYTKTLKGRRKSRERNVKM